MLPGSGAADKGTAVSFSQYGAGILTTGAAGIGVIVIVIGALGPSQPPAVIWLT